MSERKLIRALLVPLNWCFVDQGQGEKWTQKWQLLNSKNEKCVFNFSWVFGYGMSMDLHWMTPNWFGTWSGLEPTHFWPSQVP